LYKNIIITLFMFIGTCLIASVAQAQLEFLIDGYEEKYISNDEGPSVVLSSGETEDANSQYIYEAPTVKALSHMYWALGLYKTSDNKAVDEFLRINECDMYKKFSSDELEWGEIRDATKTFIESNKEDFPTRFTFTLPLQLFNYSVRRQAFEIMDEYKIIASRRFELYAQDYNLRPCNSDHILGEGFPRVLNVEFSRPFNLTHIPMTEDVANDYIKKVNKVFHKVYKGNLRTKWRMYQFRKAYLVFKIKIFAHGKYFPPHGMMTYPSAQMMGILESYSVFEDKNLTKLFYKQSYISNKNKGKLDLKLKEQYEILREKSKGDGMLN